MHRRSVLILFSFLVALVAAPVGAQDADAISEALLSDGFYVESSYSIVGLAEAMEKSADAAPFLVALDDNISDPSRFAESVLARVGFGTVIVLTPDSIGGASFDLDTSGVDARLDRVVDALGHDDDLAAAVRAFAAGPGGIGGGTVLLVLAVVGVGGITLVSVRRRRRLDRLAARRMEEARSELSRQADLVASDIVDFNSQVELADNGQATTWYRSASVTYAEVEASIPKAMTLDELEALSDRLDHARWELDAAHGTLSGSAVPDRPSDRAVGCFFDPTHRAGVVEVEVEFAGGSRKVGVCRTCAQSLRDGAPPEPGSITVDGHAVPAPQAPRHSGGGGFDWMDVFSVIVDGSRVPYSVGTRQPRRPSRLPGGVRGGVIRTDRSSNRSTGRSNTRTGTVKRSSGKAISRGRSRRR